MNDTVVHSNPIVAPTHTFMGPGALQFATPLAASLSKGAVALQLTQHVQNDATGQEKMGG